MKRPLFCGGLALRVCQTEQCLVALRCTDASLKHHFQPDRALSNHCDIHLLITQRFCPGAFYEGVSPIDIKTGRRVPSKIGGPRVRMEKYRSTSDPSTGIHPFIIVRPSSSILFIFARLLIVIRLPLLLVLSFVYGVLTAIPLLLSPIPVIAFPLHRLIDYVLLFPVLLTTSVWWPTVPTVDRPRVRTQSPLQFRPPSRGDVIFTNHASILDLLYLTWAYSPLFVIPLSHPGSFIPGSGSPAVSSDTVIPISLLTGLRRVLCAPPPETIESRKAVTLHELSSRRTAPVVVLAEGCTSNSRGVLTFLVHTPLKRPLDSAARMFALGLRYSRDCREVNTVSSSLAHMLRLLTLPCANIRARVAAVPPDTPNIQKTVASLAGVPALTIGREYGLRFYEHWRTGMEPEFR